jgi:shikimate kinase
VNTERHIRNLALIGFMGTGKSVVGQTVAAQLGFAFVDTDALIEAEAGRTIAGIFRDEGEPAFRMHEQAVVRELAARERLVIATGGGLAAHGDNLEKLQTHALVVCLWASPETIFERVRHHQHRPLLHGDDPQSRIRALLAAREPSYRRADVLINTEGRSVREVAAQVLHQFQAARRDQP